MNARSLICLIMHAMVYKYSELEVYDIPDLYYSINSSLYYLNCCLVGSRIHFLNHANGIIVTCFQIIGCLVGLLSWIIFVWWMSTYNDKGPCTREARDESISKPN
jgi:hypothetical protein